MTATEICEMCGHDADPHVLLSLDPATGGIRRCPEDLCECMATWAPNGGAPPEPETVELLTQIWADGKEQFIFDQADQADQPEPGIIPVGDHGWL